MNDIDKLTDTYSQAIEHLRSTSKWILTVFAAIAGVLVAGLQLSNLSKVEPDYLAISAGAFLFALAAVLRVVWMTVQVLGTGTVTERSLEEIATKSTDIPLNNSILLGGYDTVKDFLNNYKSVAFRYLEAEKKNDRVTIGELKDSITKLNYYLDRLLLAAKYAMVLKSFREAIKWLFGCAVVAAIAIGVFAWATGQKNTPPFLIYQAPPSDASLTLTSLGKKMLRGSLGQHCVEQAKIPVILLSVQDGKIEVVTTPGECKVAKFTVGIDMGTVRTFP